MTKKDKEPFRAIYKKSGAVMVNREPETEEEFDYMRRIAIDGLTREALTGKYAIFPEKEEKHGKALL